MKHSHTIVSIWGLSVAILVATLAGTYAIQNQLEAQAEQSVAVMPMHKLENNGNAQKGSLKLSMQIISEVYDVPNFEYSGAVLGEQTAVVNLKQEEIADITTSTVIRVFNDMSGTVSLPEFDIDLLNGRFVPNGGVYSEKITALSTGTGFFIDDNGHILTNSHVVDKEVALDDFTEGVLDYYGGVLEKSLYSMDEATQNALREKLIAQYGGDPQAAALLLAEDLYVGITKYISEEAKVDAEQTITVLDPESQGSDITNEEDLRKLINKGFKAKLVAWNADYDTTHKDVAILKIASTPTPYLSLNDSDAAATGQQIYIIGFPANAEVSNSDLFSRSMTQGSVNSVKKLDDIEVYQTDAKISQGSSGSPMLNEKGEVIGIISFLQNGAVGDNFGYAVPIKHAKEMMKSNSVTVSGNPYMASFVSGVSLAAQSLCRKANIEFASSQNLDPAFKNGNLQKYVDRCNETIAAGQSKDGTMYKITEYIKNIPVYLWAGAIFLIIVSVVSFLLYRKYRHLELAPAQFVQQ